MRVLRGGADCCKAQNSVQSCTMRVTKSEMEQHIFVVIEALEQNKAILGPAVCVPTVSE